MPRKKLARRFEPRYGVSQAMLDQECNWLERELDDKLVQSTNELTEKLAELRGKLLESDKALQGALATLPDRERLAIRCMLLRDAFHIGALYETFLRTSATVQNATGATTEAPPEVDQRCESVSPLVFQSSLFD
jgi:hypothetical protein